MALVPDMRDLVLLRAIKILCSIVVTNADIWGTVHAPRLLMAHMLNAGQKCKPPMHRRFAHVLQGFFTR